MRGGADLLGQINVHWENKPTARELLSASKIIKLQAADKPSTGMVLQLDGAPTPRFKQVLLALLWNISFGWWLHWLKVPPPVGIYQEAKAVALGSADCLFSESARPSGCVLTVDFLGCTQVSEKMIENSIHYSKANAIQFIKVETKAAESVKLEGKKVNWPFKPCVKVSKVKSILFKEVELPKQISSDSGVVANIKRGLNG